MAFSASDEPVTVKGNVHAIGDAIRNLVENAIGHSPGKSEITVSVLPAGSVSVVDQGPGIAKEDQDKIFQRFWRGKGVASGGAGLGLAIVKEVMDAHRGRITVDVGLNGGSIFTLYFPPAEPA